MRICISAAITGGLLLLLMGCGGTQYYTVTTKEGREFVSAGQPELDNSKRTYEFKTSEGQKIILNQTEVQSIQERPNYPN